MSKNDFRVFLAACIGVVVLVGVSCWLLFFCAIELQRMRNETPQQTTYNRCLQQNAYNTAGKNCAYILRPNR